MNKYELNLTNNPGQIPLAGFRRELPSVGLGAASRGRGALLRGDAPRPGARRRSPGHQRP